MRFNNIVLTVLVCLVWSSTSVAETAGVSSKELLTEALKASNSINNSVPIKGRIENYKKIFSNLGEIIADHPGSDEAVKLLSGQSIGNFNAEALQSSYISDLSSYYDKVCEVTPSYQCLGFVSLAEGSRGCTTSKSFDGLMMAHSQLLNAINIFGGQKSDKSLIQLSLNAYRGCSSKSSYRSGDWEQDQFASDLIPTLLKTGNRSIAKAIIETMTTPFFKFRGVIELQKVGNQASISRLDSYIEESMTNQAAFLANLELRKFAAQHTSMPIDYGWAFEAIQKVRAYGSKKCEVSAYPKFLAQSLFEYVLALEAMRGTSRYDGYDVIYREIYQREYMEQALNACERGLSTKLGLAVSIAHLKGTEAAISFWESVRDNNLSRLQLYDLYLDLLDKTKPHRWITSYPEKALVFSMYKRRVDLGAVCPATKTLFNELKDSPFYDDAIAYIVSSPSVDPEKKYNCGDEELELLLR